MWINHWVEVNFYIWNKTVIAYTSMDRQLKTRITAWPNLGINTNKDTENGNKSTKYTDSYFIAGKAYSEAK